MDILTQKLNNILKHYTETEQSGIKRAYEVAYKVLDGKTRENKHPFIEHPLGVAEIVSGEIGLGYDAITAIFLHESTRFKKDISDICDVSKLFSKEIINIAESLNKISMIKTKETGLQADNYKRLIVSYSSDPRVTVIKIADRLDVIRNIKLLPPENQKRKIAETVKLYIPIAHQLGLYNIKSELEDIAFQQNEPENYRLITNKLAATKLDRDKMFNTFIKPLKVKLHEEGIKCKIKSRTKTAFSIWKKMQKQKVPFEGVYDVSAIRIIIDAPMDNHEKELALCWKVYSLVTEKYTPDTNRLRDWITNPKKNGYESLHTTVKNEDGIPIEVQIRTTRMDDMAENGLASHWSYKGVSSTAQLNSWLQNVRDVMNSHEKLDSENVDNLIKEDVFVFTPNGDLRRLRNGACVLDFAFDIHTNIGITCSAAKVDGKIVSIREKLSTGSVVEIIRNKNQKPSADWLNFVVTSKARTKIKQIIKEEETKKANIGKELLGRRLKNWKLSLHDEDLHVLCKKFSLKTINEFYAKVGEEKIDLADIKNYIKEKENTEESKDKKIIQNKTQEEHYTRSIKESNDYLVIDGKLNNIGYKMAKCCNPIYGDDVFGFVTVNNGITIHRITCPNAARLINKYPYRIQKVKWKKDVETTNFQTTLKIIVDDSRVFSDIIIILDTFGCPLRSSSIHERTSQHNGYNIKVQISVLNNSILDSIIVKLKRTKGVSTVIRS
ncbi:MAG: RelA/SpoT family protein [Bacteroidales bacterium]